MLGDDHVTRDCKDLVERIPCDLPNEWQCDTHRLLTATSTVVAGGHPCDQNHDSCIQNPCDQNLVTGTTMVVTRIPVTRILWPESYDQNSCNHYLRAKNHNPCVRVLVTRISSTALLLFITFISFLTNTINKMITPWRIPHLLFNVTIIAIYAIATSWFCLPSFSFPKSLYFSAHITGWQSELTIHIF